MDTTADFTADAIDHRITAMTRHLLPVLSAALRIRKHDQASRVAAVAQPGRTAVPAHSTGPAGRARLTNFRRAIPG